MDALVVMGTLKQLNYYAILFFFAFNYNYKEEKRENNKVLKPDITTVKAVFRIVQLGMKLNISCYPEFSLQGNTLHNQRPTGKPLKGITAKLLQFIFIS